MGDTKVVESKTDASGKPAKKKTDDNGLISRIGKFFTGVKVEFKKIIWPTKDDIIKQTTAVVAVSIVTCALIAVLDYAFEYGMNFITSIF
ncbi:MAG: preprotein translocase subunit SecE [Butyrivibrio sp.]|nr:preprotein translocase subunit SecE [Butyrivibrio sp.]